MTTNSEFDSVIPTNPYSSPATVDLEPVFGSKLGEYSGFWIRFAALFIDGIALFAINMVLTMIMGGLIAVGGADNPAVMLPIVGGYYLVIFGVSWAYFALQESSAAQATLGKRALGLVVADVDGERISLARATGRWAAHGISNLTLLIGYVIQPFTGNKQALHDMIAGTVVMNKQTVGQVGGQGTAKPNNNGAVIVIVAVVAVFAVIAVIGILAAIAIPQYSEYQNKALVKLAQSDARNATIALMGYSQDHTEPPSSIDDLSIKSSPNVELKLLDDQQGVKATITKSGALQDKSIAYVIHDGETSCITNLPKGKAPNNCEIQESL